MRIGLFIPCFIDAFHPEVGVATLALLQGLGHEVVYPRDQTCCGQPMGNAGFDAACAAVERLFVRNFTGFDAIVCPSASCVNHVRNKFDAIADAPEVRAVRAATYELVEFLHDVAGPEALPRVRFAHRVGLHNSCSALRAIGHEPAPETHVPFFSKPRALLARVDGLEIVPYEREDECCGFGGTYAVTEEAISVAMGRDKVERQARAGVDYVVSADTSCLMHQQGCAERIGLRHRFLHIAQVLAGMAA